MIGFYRVWMLALAFGMSACGPKDDPENNGNNSNTNNTTNNIADMDMPDTGEDMPEDMAEAVFKCVNTSWAPYTIPAAEGGEVRFEFGCTGGNGDVTAPIGYTLTYPDGTTTEGTVEAALTQGTFDVLIDVPAREFVAGPIVVSFHATDESGVFEWDDARAPELRFHQTVSEIGKTWEGLANFTPTPPNSSATLLEMIPGDYNNDGTLDVLTVWRWGNTLAVQTYFAAATSNQTAGALKETIVGLDAGHLGPEFVRLVRRKDAATGAEQSVHWVAHDPTSQDLYLAVAKLTDGVFTEVTTFNTTAPGIAKTEAILGIEAVDLPGVMSGDSPEILVLVRGTTGGVKEVFATFTTNSREARLSHFSVMDSLAGVTPAQHRAGTHHAGLVRGPSGTADYRIIYDAAKLYAWTVGPTGDAGAFEMRRVSINPTEAGTLLSTTAVPDGLATEDGFALQAMELTGDNTNDLILSSNSLGEPTVRTWTVDLEGTVSGYRTRHLGNGMLGNCGFRQDLAADRSFQPLFYKPLTAIPNEVTFATTLETTFDPGNPIGVEVVWGSSTDAHLTARPLPKGGSAALSNFDPKTKRVMSSRIGDSLNLSVQTTDDKVLVASHPGGLGIYLDYTGNMLVTGSKTNGGTFDLPPRARMPWIMSADAGDDEDFPSTWAIIVGAEDGGTWNFHVWSVDAAGISGPGILKVSGILGSFQPTTSSGSNTIFADATGGEFKAFSVPTESLIALGKAKETLTITADQVKALGGTTTEFPVHLRDKVIPGTYKNVTERAAKARELQRKNMGIAAVNNGQETVSVVGYESVGLCDLKTVIYPGELGSADAVTLAEGAMEGCWDLHVPEVFADVCGVGGVQLVTGAATDTTARSQWVWTYYLWTRQGSDIVATELGRVNAPPQERPSVTSSDINGDGTMDLLIRINNDVMAPGTWPDTVIFGDGLAGGLPPANAIPNFTGEIRHIPGAGANQGGGQTACGQGLQCNLGTGTRTSSSQANSKAELL